MIETSVARRNPGRQDGVTGVAREAIGPTPVRRADLEEKANFGRSHPVAIIRKGRPVRGNLDGEVHGTEVHRVVVTRVVVQVEIGRKRVCITDLVEKVNVGQSHCVAIIRKGRLELGNLVGEVHGTVVHRVVARGAVRVEIGRKRVRPTDLVEKVNVGQSHRVAIIRKGRLELGNLIGEVHGTLVHRVVARGVVPVEIDRKGHRGQDGVRRALARHAGILIDDLKHVILVKVTMDRVDQEAKCVTNDHPGPMDEVRQATM